jgi:hypothetical protein
MDVCAGTQPTFLTVGFVDWTNVFISEFIIVMMMMVLHDCMDCILLLKTTLITIFT